MKNKKGFTLIELLAVIVILAIIALIAVPIILNMINQANKSAAKSSALGYIDAIEYNNGFAETDQPGYTEITGDNLDVTEITVKLKGKKPSSGTVTINSSGKVTSAEICINGYTVEYDGQDAEVKNKCNESSQPSIPEPVSFSTDSWATIAANTTSDKYHVGDEKEVSIGSNSYTVRLANKSTPAACSTAGYSQTACGFVVEFVDIVERRQMNTSDTNAGGWKETAMRTYLNGDFYDSLPVDLRNVIKPTNPVVSGSGRVDSGIENSGVSENTSDKIYLLSGREVGFDLSYDNKKDETTDTRILDYYSTNNNYNSKKKKDLNGNEKAWWLRSASSTGTYGFIVVDSGGGSTGYDANDSCGAAPAFRVGN